MATIAALFGWLLLHGDRVRRRSSEAAEPAEVATTHSKQWSPRTQKEPAPGCKPEAATTCIDGDVWWVDSCGESYARAHDCGDRRCVDGACEIASPAGCGDVTALGSCRRDVAKICQVDRVIEIDCHAQGKRCVMADDGPICRERTADDCPADAKPACRGSTLRVCEEGAWKSYDCDALGGSCETGGGNARCVFALPPAGADCGPCGCTPALGAEVCNGRDDDGDGAIDEDTQCDPVPIAVFVVGDDGGASSYSDEDVRDAIAELDTTFARDDGLGLSFELLEIVRIPDSAALELDMTDVDRLLRSDRLTVAAEEFYVPVLMTDVVLAQGVPRPGISTVPNGVCGGQRRVWQRQPVVGIVAIAKERWPTTLAHELGHFLGLCHTHESPPIVEQVQQGAGELVDAPSCNASCPDDPDGLCDTVADPGPESCAVDPECAIHCASGDRPDPHNMMAYYPQCRTLFSREQALLMRRSLALRRGWHDCDRGDGCTCTPEAQDCPDEMSCRPFVGKDGGETQWRCDLDGAAMPGGKCNEGGECGRGSICVHVDGGDGRCARTCAPGVLPCECAPIDSPEVSVCKDDLRVSDEGS